MPTYPDDSVARFHQEPAKRVVAPERQAFERDRARVVHSAGFRRLADKTQVLDPETDFIRNRLTHSLEVAQIARDIANALGCQPDVVETAALAHDLGHPPFGHHGESVLNRLTAVAGGFEGNAQTFRLLTRLEAKTVSSDRSFGLNLTRATLDACTKYPWEQHPGNKKFGVYQSDLATFNWMRKDAPAQQRCLEAQVMDFADDVAYSVHDIEDGVVSGQLSWAAMTSKTERESVWQTAREWYLPEVNDAEFEGAWEQLQTLVQFPIDFTGTQLAQAQWKNFTSDLIGSFCGSVQQATQAKFGNTNLVRYQAELVVPKQTWVQINALKAVAAHFVMRSASRLAAQAQQTEIVESLFHLFLTQPERLAPMFAKEFIQASDLAGQLRVVADQVACLTDAQATRLGQDGT